MAEDLRQFPMVRDFPKADRVSEYEMQVALGADHYVHLIAILKGRGFDIDLPLTPKEARLMAGMLLRAAGQVEGLMVQTKIGKA